MFIERIPNPNTGTIELWMCDWDNDAGNEARPVFSEKIGDEQPLSPNDRDAMHGVAPICWAYGGTLGNIAIFTPSMLASFPAEAGCDVTLPCDFVNAGKFRHGAGRWWCRTHHSHWGMKSDLETFRRSHVMACSNRDRPISYVVSPEKIDPAAAAEVAIWCSMPTAISNKPIVSRRPMIHVHVRPHVGGKKTVDRDFPAVAVDDASLGLFGDAGNNQINITPPAAFEFMRALESEREMGCISCSYCRYPHLDLGEFAQRPHRKHFCANCGHDNTWSSTAIVSTPLKPLHDRLAKWTDFEAPNRSLILDDYAGCDYEVWASTPAVVWTADRPQAKGIHVHVHDGEQRVVDDTYAEVILHGEALSRAELLQEMISRTII
ncbi:MAG: hypothetical protein M3N13_03680 [Candidatus Eremiobacteraeota bacterium]|nr:hypothetical protein [Candidatus Eremiobacteraeota bacterium]